MKKITANKKSESKAPCMIQNFTIYAKLNL